MRSNLPQGPARLAVPLCLLTLTATAIATVTQATATADSPAKSARTVYLVEKARLKLVSEKGSTVTERGLAYGTYNAPVTATFTIRPHSVTASVTIYPHGGSISGTAHADYKIVSNLGYFGGNFVLGHGTGKYRHAAELDHKPLGISGVINRASFETEVKANGSVAGL
jgi:hypothetical protein